MSLKKFISRHCFTFGIYLYYTWVLTVMYANEISFSKVHLIHWWHSLGWGNRSRQFCHNLRGHQSVVNFFILEIFHCFQQNEIPLTFNHFLKSNSKTKTIIWAIKICFGLLGITNCFSYTYRLWSIKKDL